MAETLAGPSAFRRRLRVLLVDDDSTALAYMRNLLESCSYEVMAVEQVSAAMKKLGRSSQFDLIIADINMKDMDAFSFLKIAVLLTNLPVVLMSNYHDFSIALKAIEEGACFFAVKPIRVEVINNLWQHVYQKRTNKTRATKGAGRPAANRPGRAIEATNREKRPYRNKGIVIEEPTRNLGNKSREPDQRRQEKEARPGRVIEANDRENRPNRNKGIVIEEPMGDLGDKSREPDQHRQEKEARPGRVIEANNRENRPNRNKGIVIEEPMEDLGNKSREPDQHRQEKEARPGRVTEANKRENRHNRNKGIVIEKPMEDLANKSREPDQHRQEKEARPGRVTEANNRENRPNRNKGIVIEEPTGDLANKSQEPDRHRQEKEARPGRVTEANNRENRPNRNKGIVIEEPTGDMANKSQEPDQHRQEKEARPGRVTEANNRENRPNRNKGIVIKEPTGDLANKSQEPDQHRQEKEARPGRVTEANNRENRPNRNKGIVIEEPMGELGNERRESDQHRQEKEAATSAGNRPGRVSKANKRDNSVNKNKGIVIEEPTEDLGNESGEPDQHKQEKEAARSAKNRPGRVIEATNRENRRDRNKTIVIEEPTGDLGNKRQESEQCRKGREAAKPAAKRPGRVSKANKRDNRLDRNKGIVIEEPMRDLSNERPEPDQNKEKKESERRNRSAECGEERIETWRHARMLWTEERHLKFLDAISKIKEKGKPTPKKIQDMMKEPELTLKQIASHLQKHRMRVQGLKNRAAIDPFKLIRPGVSVPLIRLSSLLISKPKFPPFIEEPNSTMPQEEASGSQNHGAQPLEPTDSSSNNNNQENSPSGNVATSSPSGIPQEALGAANGGGNLNEDGFDPLTGTENIDESYMDIQESTELLNNNSVGDLDMLEENSTNNSTMGNVENYEMPIDEVMEGLNQIGQIGGTLENINEQNLASSENTEKFSTPGSDLHAPQVVPKFPPENSYLNTVTPSVNTSSNAPDPNLAHEVQDNAFRATNNNFNVGDFNGYSGEYALDTGFDEFDDYLFLEQFDDLSFS